MLTPERKRELQVLYRQMEEQLQRRMDDMWSDWMWEFQIEHGLSDEEMEEIE